MDNLSFEENIKKKIKQIKKKKSEDNDEIEITDFLISYRSSF